MNLPTPEKIAELLTIVTAIELARRADLNAVLCDERAIRDEIATLSGQSSLPAPGFVPNVVANWNIWKIERLKALNSNLAEVLVRRASVEAQYAKASAKRRVIERMFDLATSQVRARQDTRQQDELLRTDLLMRQMKRP